MLSQRIIITIVILLILAIVTIRTINESKIIGHSKNASSEYTIAQEKEQIQLALSEWQIQKNIPGNTQNFKEVMGSALKENATVSGQNDGPLTVKFNKTNNKYIVKNDGKIISQEKISIDTYLLGEDLQGRILDMDPGAEYFYNEEVEFMGVRTEDSDSLDKYIMYVKYEGNEYKIRVTIEDEEDENGNMIYIITSDSSYGIQEVSVEGERVGKKVKYDNKMWTILYDDETNGLQMVCDNIISEGDMLDERWRVPIRFGLI